MNNKKSHIMFLLLSFILSSCSIGFNFGYNSSYTSESRYTSTSESSLISSLNDQPSNYISNVSYNSSSIIEPSSSIESSTSNSSSTSIENTINKNDCQLLRYSGDDFNNKKLKTYKTGNMERLTFDGIEFEFYRVFKNDDNNLISLLKSNSIYQSFVKPSSFFNKTEIHDIRYIDISYYMEEGDNKKATLRYGKDPLTNISVDIPYSNTLTTASFEISEANYFKIENNDLDLTIESLNIYYTGKDYNWPINSYLSSGTNGYRLNPVRFYGQLESGVSSVTVPMKIEVNNMNYNVTEWKTYTYYSYESVINDETLVEAASYIDPIDVANYFIAFGTYPANYVTKKEKNTAKLYFGDKTRQVSNYSRTDGYAKDVPYSSVDGLPLYYECDIDLDGTYESSRGAGRVVVWVYGFDSQDYDDAPVAVFTDDHYASFYEYYNNGTWSIPFNADGYTSTSYQWGSPTTLNK